MLCYLNMENNSENQFKYLDYSNNIFTKIQLVNSLTLKEIDKLNEKYKELGLFIKLVHVDNFGNIKHPDDILSVNDFLNKKRRLTKHKMTLQEFYDKYYCNDLNIKKKPKNNKKVKQNKYDYYDNDDEFCSNEDLLSYKICLKDVYKNCQNIQYKKCKIDDKDFKLKIINYINEFKKYISKKQYLELFNKWKNENSKILGVNLFNINSLEDFKIPILKAFKSEISLLAFTNSLDREKKDNSEEEEKKDNEEEEEEEDEDEDNSNEDKSESNSDGNNNNSDDNQAEIINLKKLENNNDEEE